MYDVTLESRETLQPEDAIRWWLRRGRACARAQAFLARVTGPLVAVTLRVDTAHSDSRVGFDPLFVLRVLRDGSDDRSAFEPFAPLLDGAQRGTFRAELPSPLMLATVDYRGGTPDSLVSAGLQDSGTYELLTTAPFAETLREAFDSAAWPGLDGAWKPAQLARVAPVPVVRSDLAWLDSGFWVDSDEGFRQVGPALAGAARAIALGPEDDVWVTTTEGLFRCSSEGARRVHLGKKSLKQSLFTPLCVVGDVVWVGTYSSGLFGVHADGSQVQIAGGKNKPLPNRNVTDLARGPDGSLLIRTNKGAVRRDATGAITEVDDADEAFRRDLPESPAPGRVGGAYVGPGYPSSWSLCTTHAVVAHDDGRAFAPLHPRAPGLDASFAYEGPQVVFLSLASAGDVVAIGGFGGVLRMRCA